MTSLSRELGLDYMDQFYKGAYFSVEGEVYQYVRHVDNDTLRVKKVREVGNDLAFADTHIASDKIQSMDDLGWPTLGYRQMTLKGTDLGVYFVSATRSAMRGLKDDFIQFSPMPVTALLGPYENPRSFARASMYANEIFKPKFTGFLEGMQMIREGKTSAFALNENIAVGLSTNQAPGRDVDVFYKENVIGQVLEDDVVVVPKRIARRPSSIRLFEGKVK